VLLVGPPAQASRSRGGGARAGALAAVALGVLMLAPPALAGQIVWSTGGGIWAMRDDGSDPHELLSAALPPLATTLEHGTLASPDVFQNGGTTVLFLGQTKSYASSAQPLACGVDCSATYELHAGLLTQLGPAPGPAADAAYYEGQPRMTADGQELFGSVLYSPITGSSLPAPVSALVERALSADAQANEWAATGSQTEPAAGFDGTPDPADATQAAWVAAQGCGYHVADAQGVSQPSCQYEVQFGPVTATADAPVVIYDNEYVSAAGAGPTSLALSSDGATLLMVDPYAPNTGIYTTPVAGVPGAKPVTEVLSQPVGWSFGQARFAGAKIVFDAHQQHNGAATGDIYTVPATCTAASCTFPTAATNLTHDAAADSSDPAWTSASAPLPALSVAGHPRVTAVTAAAKSIAPGAKVHLSVTLSAAGTIVVRVTGRPGAPATPSRSRVIGTLRFPGQAGANTVVIGRVHGRALAPGVYTAWISLGGSPAGPRLVHFRVHP
jgi:hypothetical protein